MLGRTYLSYTDLFLVARSNSIRGFFSRLSVRPWITSFQVNSRKQQQQQQQQQQRRRRQRRRRQQRRKTATNVTLYDYHSKPRIAQIQKLYIFVVSLKYIKFKFGMVVSYENLPHIFLRMWCWIDVFFSRHSQ